MNGNIPDYRLKVERAKAHIAELAKGIQAFFASKPYSIVIEDDVTAGQRVWKVKVRECVPQNFSTIIGDAIHNTRASLDLLAVAVVRRCDPGRQSYNHVHFVIRETEEKFKADLGENIKGASPAARLIFESLKPYKGGDEAFWRLHQLDILDKHKAIIPVGASYNSVDLLPYMAATAEHGLGGEEGAKFAKMMRSFGALRLRPADRKFPLQDGADLFRVPIADPRTADDKIQFTFDIAFGEGQIVDGESVIPALTQMCQFVEGVFPLFEADILK